MSNNVSEKSLGNVPNGPRNVQILQILASWDKSTIVPNGLVNTGGREKNMTRSAWKTSFPKNQHHPSQHGGREKPGVKRRRKIFHPSSTKKCVNVPEKSLVMFQMVPTSPKRKVSERPMWVAEKSCNVPIGLISAGTLLDILLYGSKYKSWISRAYSSSIKSYFVLEILRFSTMD